MTATEAALDTQRRGLIGVIARHPLPSFFILANALSWTAWIPYVLSHNGLGVWAFVFPIVLTRGRLGYRAAELGNVGKVDEPVLVRPHHSLQA